jgi:hypothetical protein
LAAERKMIRIILLAFVFFNSFLAISQDLQVHNPNRDMRAGFHNWVEFSLNRKFDSLDLRATQGRVDRDSANLKVTRGKDNRQRTVIRLIPETSGKDTVFAKFFYKGKFVHSDTVVFDIIKPEFFPSFGGDLLKHRKFSVAFLKSRGGIIFNIRVSDVHWEGIGAESYRFSIIRKDSCIFSTIEYSTRFSEELKSKFGLLQPGDKILISDATINAHFAKFANILPGVFEIE